MLYNIQTYKHVREELASGATLTFDTDVMEALDFSAVGYAMLDHVANLRSKR